MAPTPDDPAAGPALPPEARDRLVAACRELADRFTAAGHELYLVGGVVRDALLGRATGTGDTDLDRNSDLDCTTDARPPQTLAVVTGWADAVWRQGERFGTIGASHGGHLFEITTFRADSYDPTSRKPVVAFGDDIRDDLARRDFRVNALALSLPGAELVDPFDGVGDLRRRRLRTPLAPEVSFSDDPLRMLRAARFVAGYDLVPDPDLVAAATAMADRLAIVSVERIWQELAKLLRLDDPTAGLRLLAATGLAGRVLPELAGAGAGDASPAVLRSVVAAPADPVARVAVVVLAGLDRAVAGERAGPAVRDRLSALRASSVEVTAGSRRATLVGRVRSLAGVAVPPAGVLRSVLVDLGEDPAPALALLAALTGPGGAWATDAPALDRVGAQLAALATEPGLVPLVLPLDGAAVMARYGLEPGRAVGEALGALRAARLADGPLDGPRAEAVLDAWMAGRTPADG